MPWRPIFRSADRFSSHGRAPEALFRLALATLTSRRSGKELDARKVLESLVDRYPRAIWSARALMLKADLEERLDLYELDATLATSVPAALTTYRRLVDRDGVVAEREDALWKLGQLYERIKRFDLAARTFTTLGERFPETRHDAWASAARIYDRRLKDAALASAAYARVPPTSPHYKDAQKRAGKS